MSNQFICVLSRRERAAVLAGLRYVQREYGYALDATLPADILGQLTEHNTVSPLRSSEVDTLCNRLAAAPTVEALFDGIAKVGRLNIA